MIPGNPTAVAAEHFPAATRILYNGRPAFRTETVGDCVQEFMHALVFIHVAGIHWPPPFCLSGCSCSVVIPRFHVENLKKVRNNIEVLTLLWRVKSASSVCSSRHFILRKGLCFRAFWHLPPFAQAMFPRCFISRRNTPGPPPLQYRGFYRERGRRSPWGFTTEK